VIDIVVLCIVRIEYKAILLLGGVKCFDGSHNMELVLCYTIYSGGHFKATVTFKATDTAENP